MGSEESEHCHNFHSCISLHQIGFLREVNPLPVQKGIAECLLLEHTSPVLGQRMACKEKYILRGKREGTHRLVPGLLTAFLFKTGTGSLSLAVRTQ